MSRRYRLAHPPLVVLTVLVLMAAWGPCRGSAGPGRTVGAVALWAACVVVIVDLERMRMQRAAFGSPEAAGGPVARRWIRAALPAAALGAVFLPGEHRGLRPVLVLVPACVALLFAWHLARRSLLDTLAPSASDPEVHDISAVESLVLRGASITASVSAVAVMCDSLWGADVRWQLLRHPLPWGLALAVPWALYGGLRGVSAEMTRASFRASRDWAASEDPIRDRAWSTGAVLKALDLAPGLRVADLGTGGGYYALKMAERVGPDGQVIATDTSPVSVARLRESALRRRLSHLSVRLVDGAHPLPVDVLLDRILLANVYLFSASAGRAARRLLKGFADVLRPGGRLVIYCEFVHEAGWAAPPWPPLKASQPDARTLADWASSWFDLAAEVPLPSPARPFEPHESIGYLVVLERRAPQRKIV